MFIGVGNIIGKPISASTISDAQDFFNRVTAAGGSLTLTEQNAITQLIANMKSAGVWNKVKAAYPMVGGTSFSCKQNIKGSFFTGVFNGGWIYSSTGATPNGIDAYMDTSFIEANALFLNSEHIGVYIRTNSSGDLKIDIGANSGGNQTAVNSRLSSVSSPLTQIHSSASSFSFTVANSLGFTMANRVSSTELQPWKNGVKNTPFFEASTSLLNIPIFIGAKSSISGSTIFAMEFSDRQNAFATIGDGLTDAEAAAYYTAIQTFQTALSRQV